MVWDSDGAKRMATPSLPPAPLLLTSPCDPGSCHIYFSQQRKTLPHQLALARALRRTLILPPLEWYHGQAQVFTTVFMGTTAGRSPRFTRWSELFDLSELRASVGVVELADVLAVQVDRSLVIGKAIYDNVRGTVQETAEEEATRTEGPLSNLLAESECASHSVGLMSNFTRTTAFSSEYAGELYSARTTVRVLRCGALLLNSGSRVKEASAQLQETADAAIKLIDYFGDVHIAGVFNTGHQSHSKLTPSAHELRLSSTLAPSSDLQLEAEDTAKWLREQPCRADTDAGYSQCVSSANAVAECHREGVRPCGDGSLGSGAERPASASSDERTPCPDGGAICVAGSAPFVAIHWRHGDYAAYGYATAAERVATAARRALEELRCPSCRVFLMSNCRNQSAWEYLHDEIPTLSLYAPSSERFAGEGPRLVVEQHVALLADVFIGSGRSAVSQMVFQARGHRYGQIASRTDPRRRQYL